jgi:hypothetical protein
MAVYFHTLDPSKLLASFDAKIKQPSPTGKIVTWEKSTGGLYTHKASNWKNLAWFKVSSTNRATLDFYILHPKGGTVGQLAYAYYHGHLIETFLNHLDSDFSSANASALPEGDDDIGP